MNLLTMVAAVLSAAALLGAVAHGAELKVGDPAPDFELQGSDGKTYKLSDFKGKKAVVLAWFPKAFTGGCTAECKSMREHGAAIRALDVAYFTASADEVEKNKEFAKSLELDYPILSDPKREVTAAYGVTSAERQNPQRWTFYIDKEGKIAHIDKAVKTASAGSDIAAKVKELGLAGKK